MNDLNFGERDWSPQEVAAANGDLQVWFSETSHESMPEFPVGRRVEVDFRDATLGAEKGLYTRGVIIGSEVKNSYLPPSEQTRKVFVLIAEGGQPRVIKSKHNGTYNGDPNVFGIKPLQASLHGSTILTGG